MQSDDWYTYVGAVSDARVPLDCIPLDPGQGVSTSHDGAAHVAFERIKTLGPCDI